ERDLTYACGVCHLFDRFRADLHPWWQPCSSAMVGYLEEDSRPQLGGDEEVGVREQHLCLAKEQKAGLVQRVVESIQDPSLRLVVEVHESVPAHEEREARDGGILDQIVPAEDHRAAELFVKDVLGAHPLEVTLSQRRRYVLDVLGGIAAQPRM